MDINGLSESVKAKALEVGFDWVGICDAVSPQGFGALESWLDQGFSGEMSYLENRREAYRHPNDVLDGVASIVMLAINYRSDFEHVSEAGLGKISRYAWGESDYHDLIHAKLKQLKTFVLGLAPESNTRGVVDTAPLLEREFAVLAGLGWQAKNTMVINQQMGSWFFLAAILTDVPLTPDPPALFDHCGTCTACLDACPTDAFVEPRVLDATKCISYLTIELRSAVPTELRAGVGDWLFGCDICQDVCPWNRKTTMASTDLFDPKTDGNRVDVAQLFELDEDGFRARFRKTPLWRSKRRGILRNAAIVLGNSPSVHGTIALAKGLNDSESIVRGACAWGLGKHRDFSGAKEALANRLTQEIDPEVKTEIENALQELGRGNGTFEL